MAKDGQQDLALGDSITIFACRRGRSPAQPCSVPNCGKAHTKLCDFPLRGKREGQTCDAKLCDAHAEPIGEGKDYCPAHANFARRQEDPE